MGASTAPPVLVLAAHPIRWRLLRELGQSDRRVHELTRLVGQPQNVVSYHLARLRRAGVVAARQSTADGRDSYYAVDLARLRTMLIDAGSALHPGVVLDAPPPSRATRPRVLFVCTGNSARSQIAEALATHRSDGWIRAASGGSHPKPVHPLAVHVLRERYGIDISHARSKHLDDLAGARFDRVITLCDRVREVCAERPGGPSAAHWSIPDPAAGAGDEAGFVATAAELDTRIGFLIAALAIPSPATPTQEAS